MGGVLGFKYFRITLTEIPLTIFKIETARMQCFSLRAPRTLREPVFLCPGKNSRAERMSAQRNSTDNDFRLEWRLDKGSIFKGVVGSIAAAVRHFLEDMAGFV